VYLGSYSSEISLQANWLFVGKLNFYSHFEWEKEEKKMKKRIYFVLMLSLLSGCAGFQRGCSSFWARNAGADWIVAQYGYNGVPFNVWRLQNVSVSNEENSDGIYWKDESGHLVHISGWYNRVQVHNGRYEEAAKLLGVDISQINNGKYQPEDVKIPIITDVIVQENMAN
jgi:hypothetical protein